MIVCKLAYSTLDSFKSVKPNLKVNPGPNLQHWLYRHSVVVTLQRLKANLRERLGEGHSSEPSSVVSGNAFVMDIITLNHK